MTSTDAAATPAAAHHDLEDVVDHIIALADRRMPAHGGDGRVCVGDLMDAIGERSFGPLLLVPSLIALSPVGAIPGLPFFTSCVIILVSGQMLLGHDHFWIPGWLSRRSMDAHVLQRGLNAFRPVARAVDHILRPRLSFLTDGPFAAALALLCLLVGLVTPILELIPFVGGIPPNAAVVAFSLAMTARDGVWALFAFGLTGLSAWLVLLAL